MERQHNYWGQTWRVIKPVFNKYPDGSRFIAAVNARVRREETGDGGFTPGITDSVKNVSPFWITTERFTPS